MFPVRSRIEQSCKFYKFNKFFFQLEIMIFFPAARFKNSAKSNKQWQYLWFYECQASLEMPQNVTAVGAALRYAVDEILVYLDNKHFNRS